MTLEPHAVLTCALADYEILVWPIKSMSEKEIM
jgi:hypothetical protein